MSKTVASIERGERLAIALQKCGKITRQGGGDRYSHSYCDDLPNGHSCACSSYPDSALRAEMVVEALIRAGFTVTDPPDLTYQELCKD